MLHEELIPAIGVSMVRLLFGFNTNHISYSNTYESSLSQTIH